MTVSSKSGEASSTGAPKLAEGRKMLPYTPSNYRIPLSSTDNFEYFYFLARYAVHVHVVLAFALHALEFVTQVTLVILFDKSFGNVSYL